MGLSGIEKSFSTFASKVSRWAGSSFIFFSALSSIIVWAAMGPYFQFSAGWQMVVNTGTTIATFLMVFIIQNSQNREGLALQIKLDEVIRALDTAENTIIDLEDLSQEELENLKTHFAVIAKDARATGIKMPNAKIPVRSRTSDKVLKGKLSKTHSA